MCFNTKIENIIKRIEFSIFVILNIILLRVALFEREISSYIEDRKSPDK